MAMAMCATRWSLSADSRRWGDLRHLAFDRTRKQIAFLFPLHAPSVLHSMCTGDQIDKHKRPATTSKLWHEKKTKQIENKTNYYACEIGSRFGLQFGFVCFVFMWDDWLREMVIEFSTIFFHEIVDETKKCREHKLATCVFAFNRNCYSIMNEK